VVPSRKKCSDFGEPIYWRCGATDLTGRNEEKWFPPKERGGPLRTRFSGCLYANGLGRAAMRKSGSFEKSNAPLVS